MHFYPVETSMFRLKYWAFFPFNEGYGIFFQRKAVERNSLKTFIRFLMFGISIFMKYHPMLGTAALLNVAKKEVVWLPVLLSRILVLLLFRSCVWWKACVRELQCVLELHICVCSGFTSCFSITGDFELIQKMIFTWMWCKF